MRCHFNISSSPCSLDGFTIFYIFSCGILRLQLEYPSTIYSNIYISCIVKVRQTKSNGSCKGQDKVFWLFSQFHPAYWQFDFWWRYYQDTRRKTLDLYSINIEDEFEDKLKNFFLKKSEQSCCDIILFQEFMRSNVDVSGGTRQYISSSKQLKVD